LYPKEIAYVEIRPVTKMRKETSWIEFHERTNQLVNALLDKGITEGTSVFLLGKNSLSWLECYFGVLKTGAWIIPLNFRFTDEDIRFCTQVAEPTAFIFDKEYASRIETLRDSMSSIQSYVCVGQADSANLENLETIIRNGVPGSTGISLEDQKSCALYFTSGTTGAPKPVLVNHANLFCSAMTESTNNRLHQEDSLLLMPPLYHLAIGHLLGLLAVGGTTVLLTEQITPRYILETLERERISFLFLLVPWALDLLEALDKKQLLKEDYDLSAWHFTLMGAQPIPVTLVKRLKGFFPDMQFDTTYGLSESTGPGVIHLGIENEHKLGAIGKEALTWSARVIDTKGKDVETGQVRELLVKGNGVMTEYYKNPELTSQTIEDGWLHTGDLARRDTEGFIFLVDRKKDLVICGGENIYPAEVEQIILQHPKIHDVAIIGTPNDRLGEIVIAVIQIVSGETLSEDEVIAFCEKELPRSNLRAPSFLTLFHEVPREKLKNPNLERNIANTGPINRGWDMAGDYEHILIEKAHRVAVLTFNRPLLLNTFTSRMASEFDAALDVLEKDEDVSVVVLTGAGKAFSAGQELQSLQTDSGELRKAMKHLKKPRLLHFEKPVIAAVNGAAIGAGADHVLMCDIVIASEKARFSFPGAKMGFVCPYALIRLGDEIGRAAAKELMMTGRIFEADEALALGLVNKVVPPDQLMDETRSLGQKIAQSSPLALQAIKEGVNRGLEGYEYSYETMVALMSTEDCVEGRQAFLQKREPRFKGK